jgi:hypothetical protein
MIEEDGARPNTIRRCLNSKSAKHRQDDCQAQKQMYEQVRYRLETIASVQVGGPRQLNLLQIYCIDASVELECSKIKFPYPIERIYMA